MRDLVMQRKRTKSRKKIAASLDLLAPGLAGKRRRQRGDAPIGATSLDPRSRGSGEEDVEEPGDAVEVT